MDDESIQFDDPNLKAAIARVRGGHRARPELVERVRESLQDGLEDGPVAPLGAAAPLRIGRRPMLRHLAVAASIVVAFLLGVLTHSIAHKYAEAQEYLEANEKLFRAMIGAHEGKVGGRPEVFASALSPTQLRQQLAERLAHDVPVPDLTAQGWTLREAAVVQVQALPAARCVFARGGSTLTLLSLPSAAFVGAEENSTYQTVVDGHPLAGFIRGGGVHCVVGDANTPLSDITPLTDQLRRL